MIQENLKQVGIRRVLARKYRCKTLSELIGQDILVQSLKKGIEEKRIPQAILLNGIRGTGKTSTARIIARSINCIGKGGDMTITPCGSCKSCLALDSDSHPDVIEMDAASHTGVDDIREIIDSAMYKAILGHYKVFIIDEVHMLSKSAFNALLKTLEEPPAHVLFIFATTEINKIPETIFSRCACFDLKRVDSKTIMNHLKKIVSTENYTIEEAALALISQTADGSVRDSLTLLDQAMNLTELGKENKITIEMVRKIIGATDREYLFDILLNIFKKNKELVIERTRNMLCDGADPVRIMQDLLECLYRVSCFKILPQLSLNEVISEFEKKAALNIVSSVEEVQLLTLWKIMLKGYSDVKSAPLANQALEMVLLRLCVASQIPPIDNLLSTFTPEISNTGAPPSSTFSNNSYTSQSSMKHESVQLNENISGGKEENSSTTIAPILHSEINTTSDLLSILEQKREVLLLSYINKDMVFVNFQNGEITINLRKKESEKIVPLLKKFLYSQTGKNWIINITEEGDTLETYEEKINREKEERQTKIIKSDIVQELQKKIPGCDLEFI